MNGRIYKMVTRGRERQGEQTAQGTVGGEDVGTVASPGFWKPRLSDEEIG